MEEEVARATLVIELNVSCPGCENYFDLVADTRLNEEGWLLNNVLPEKSWINAHENFECFAICPECSLEFVVKGVDW